MIPGADNVKTGRWHTYSSQSWPPDDESGGLSTELVKVFVRISQVPH